MNMMHRKIKIFALLICLVISFTACTAQDANQAYAVLNNNVPQFEENEITTVAFEEYSELDELKRCGVAFACLGEEIMPTEERGAIGQIKPSGWQMAKYDIVDGMLPFENMVADYIKETKNHVMYRVTPVFEGDNLLAKGVQMEALSVEDDGEGVSFNVFVNNIQPGVEINYLDGTSKLKSENDSEKEPEQEKQKIQNENNDTIYILNTNTMKFHNEECSSVKDIKPQNKETFNGTRAWLIDNEYSPCGVCNP